MESKELEFPFSFSLSCTCEHEEARKWRPFAGLIMPWDQFYCFQTERLSRIAARLGVSPDRIDDVIQEAWLDALKHRRGFQGDHVDRRLSCWLTAVIRSKSRDALRRHHRRHTKSLEELPADPVDRKTQEPKEQMEKREEDAIFAARLEELRKEDPLNHKLLIEHKIKKRSLKELATELGLTAHAMTCRIDRTLKRLRSRLRE